MLHILRHSATVNASFDARCKRIYHCQVDSHVKVGVVMGFVRDIVVVGRQEGSMSECELSSCEQHENADSKVNGLLPNASLCSVWSDPVV